MGYIYLLSLGLITPQRGVINAPAAGRLGKKGKLLFFEFHNIMRDSPSVVDTTPKNRFVV